MSPVIGRIFMNNRTIGYPEQCHNHWFKLKCFILNHVYFFKVIFRATDNLRCPAFGEKKWDALQGRRVASISYVSKTYLKSLEQIPKKSLTSHQEVTNKHFGDHWQTIAIPRGAFAPKIVEYCVALCLLIFYQAQPKFQLQLDWVSFIFSCSSHLSTPTHNNHHQPNTPG